MQTPIRVRAGLPTSSGSRVQETVGKVNEGLRRELPGVGTKLRLYLTSANTQALLTRPIKANLLEATQQLQVRPDR